MKYLKDFIKCICIDDSNKPIEIHKLNWVKKNKEYTIVATSWMERNKKLGFYLAEIETNSKLFVCYDSSRFAFREEDIEKFKNHEPEFDLQYELNNIFDYNLLQE